MGSHGNNNRRKGPRELVTGGEWIYGRNPVEEALAAGRRSATEIVLPAAFPDEDDQIRRIRDEAHARRLVVRTMERDQLDRLTRFGHHQGVALKTSGYPYVDLVDIIQDAADDENALVVVLDHLADPRLTRIHTGIGIGKSYSQLGSRLSVSHSYLIHLEFSRLLLDT